MPYFSLRRQELAASRAELDRREAVFAQEAEEAKARHAAASAEVCLALLLRHGDGAGRVGRGAGRGGVSNWHR